MKPRRPPMRACPVEGCGAAIQHRFLMCRKHWMYVPLPLQDRIRKTARMADGGMPSRHYVKAAREAIELVNAILETQTERGKDAGT